MLHPQSLNVTVPQWTQTSTWGVNGVLTRFDNVLMAIWVLLQVGKLWVEAGGAYRGTLGRSRSWGQLLRTWEQLFGNL